MARYRCPVPPTVASKRSSPEDRFLRLKAVRLAIRSTDSYGLLLVLLFADYLLLSLVDNTRWFGLVVGLPISLTLLLALKTSQSHPRGIHAAQLAVIFTLVAGLANAIFHFTGGDGAVILLISLLLAVTPFVILRRILTMKMVSVETILGALCVYLLIGIFFTLVFTGIARIEPVIYGTPLPQAHWFLAQSPAEHPVSDYLYLSFVTITTVGFGDLTPLTKLARSVVVLEAIIGQIFMVTLVARLVAMYGTERSVGNPRPMDRYRTRVQTEASALTADGEEEANRSEDGLPEDS
jgi:voltage-gated potassium channel